MLNIWLISSLLAVFSPPGSRVRVSMHGSPREHAARREITVQP
jgi:hypothetical protein